MTTATLTVGAFAAQPAGAADPAGVTAGEATAALADIGGLLSDTVTRSTQAPGEAISAGVVGDADGAPVATSDRIDGATIAQTVDHHGAAYPVVADPSWVWWAWTAASCAAQVALLVSSGGSLLAARLPRVAPAISRMDRTVRAEMNALQGRGSAAEKIGSLLSGAVNKDIVTASDEVAFKMVGSSALGIVGEALGVGTCVSLAGDIAT